MGCCECRDDVGGDGVAGGEVSLGEGGHGGHGGAAGGN